MPGDALEFSWTSLAPRGGPGSTVVVDMPGTGPNPWSVLPMMEGGELLVPNASGRSWGDSKVSGDGVASSIASGAAWGLSVSLGGCEVPESPLKMVWWLPRLEGLLGVGTGKAEQSCEFLGSIGKVVGLSGSKEPRKLKGGHSEGT